ncbi:hypothetical protein P153DRAFT_401030 [Dothidotthia symphoricarpi CBS 119687]|uniref:DUF6594 domain-containing protein n=1 Tax=Dothidotthia symphoricarpi CBS 119687 TaxID=1392245 RepID=A0A6A5ZZS4_9PLEO|nr:uncharacterized protein P153DRAFT_401030 [Dothidotthia symphoricarpi CBS 119687]KAF2124404.1 hypothetical protein P153DRAFT_401030 [Dothidotthia symphoricarpi CBS 119687]
MVPQGCIGIFATGIANIMSLTSEICELNSIAGFMTGDSDLWITSRFERLHLINLLSIQRQLSNLEEEINDHVLYERHLVGHEPHPKPTRVSKEIFADLQGTIKAYGDAISSLKMLKESEAPAPHIVKAVKEGTPQSAILFKDLSISGDLSREAQRQLCVATKQRDWVHRFIGRHARLARMFGEEHMIKGVHYTKFSEDRLRKVEFGTIAVCLCVVQLLPVLALTLVSSKTLRLAIIVILIILVSIMNSLFANTVRATNFGAVAAYSAIVVVFLSQND